MRRDTRIKEGETLYMDILIYLVIAAFLFYRLNAVLGRRNGRLEETDHASKQQSAEVVPLAAHRVAPVQAPVAHYNLADIVDATANVDGRVEQGLADIATEDTRFNPSTFIDGAKKAFEYIVTAYARGDVEMLKPLLSPKLFNDFTAGAAARTAAGHTAELSIQRIKAAKIKDAHLGGVMAYATVMFEVEETTVTRDSEGKVVDGDPDTMITVQDVWTFTRDTRGTDPNWVLIETGVVEQA